MTSRPPATMPISERTKATDRPGATAPARLTRQDWLLAGQDLLRSGGFRAVKLRALTDSVGATTGSFYHHFEDMQQYLDSLASYYGTELIETSLAEADDPDPEARLVRIMTMSRKLHMGPLDSAMRVWAASSPIAKASVRRTDERMLQFLERAIGELGFSADESRLRARALLSLGVARIYAPWTEREDDIEATLRLILRRPSSSSPHRSPGPSVVSMSDDR